MKPKYIMVDIEADGPVPPLYSMIWFGAVIVDDQLDKKFEGKLLPISKTFNPEALAISGLTREQTYPPAINLLLPSRSAYQALFGTFCLRLLYL